MSSLGLKLAKNPVVELLFKTPWIGIYPSYAAALAAIPPNSQVGYDQTQTQEVFSTYPVDRVRPADYAILLHLRSLLKASGRLVDLGGNIGMACYTAQKFFELPEGFQWILCDVPKVIETAKAVAAREGESSRYLRYISDLKDAGLCDIFFSSGTLQYIESPLPQLLSLLPELPEAVLINRVPVWDRPAIVTLNDIGFCIAPYHVFNHKQLLLSMQELGYRLVDTWPCPESTFSVRFRPYMRLNSYQGFYWKRIS